MDKKYICGFDSGILIYATNTHNVLIDNISQPNCLF